MIEGAPIWDMHNLSSLILVDCERVKVEEVINGLPKMNYLTYLNICIIVAMKMEITGFLMMLLSKFLIRKVFKDSI